MRKAKRLRFNSRLPATPVTERMRSEVEDWADNHDMNLSEVVRAALSVFLSQSGIKNTSNDTKDITRGA